MKLFSLSGIAFAGVLTASGALAQDYPEKDITHIMPWSAGGGTDTVMRTFMNFAEQQLGVGINTQNVTGAQSGVGTLKLMKSRPDGYTIGSLTWDSVITVPYYELVPGYSTDQLDYLGSVTVHPTALIVAADAPWNTLEDFIAAAKETPGELSISNVGSGGVWHLPALDLADAAGIEVQHIPYPDGSGPQREALLSGETDAASLSISAAYPAVDSGQAKVLAVFGDERSEFAPDAPTAKELGYDVVWGSFRLIAAPKGVDPEKLEALENAFAAVFDMPEFQAQAEETGMGAVWMDADATAAYVEASQEKAFSLIDALVEQGLLEK
ncbi:Bug family tripartite tricarboxylate transporter substrate binding protein [Qingshengfaniella alkalisoli]|uniref:Tripartite tricarboxylate transporter substrate binding protein n=1 Tax=Qingshengfaniella alkalisoli TaxID=2599296 RepID=A0A5B8IBK7_9RHOB|nr:tripartite tricarboxylate transporter substrate binding protein [Qingshengfaniella alkalisoli]QDY70826.1 tripartite tricarboxylate transporter substrate binding protein [Qingshengfaniella alkalisoli]